MKAKNVVQVTEKNKRMKRLKRKNGRTTIKSLLHSLSYSGKAHFTVWFISLTFAIHY